MESILIANSNSTELKELEALASQDFEVHSITSEEEFDAQPKKFDLIVLDQNFTHDAGTRFLMKIVSEHHVPVLMITSPDDAYSAFAALRLGAHNYLVKTDNYQELLNLVIKDVIRKFSEQQRQEQTIVTLKSRVAELEERVGILTRQVTIQKQASSQDGKTEIIEEINSSFKRGEINLPSLPEIAIKFRQMVAEGASIEKIGHLLRQDTGLSFKLIGVSNSAAYRGVTENKTLDRAISRLGLRTTKMYVDVISNRALYTTSSKKYTNLMKNLWEHSISCAHASEIVSQALRSKAPDEIFTMGLVHDIGKLILLQILSELEIRGKLKDEVDRGELRETLDAHHGRFGAVLLRSWKFPDAYSQICRYHDNVEEADPVTKELLLVHFTNLLVKSMGYGQEERLDINLEGTDSARLLKVDSSMITEFKAKVEGLMQETMKIVT
jgi:HD-like signal output (HDOD) protein/ActR/RegA family two-component response regulator